MRRNSPEWPNVAFADRKSRNLNWQCKTREAGWAQIFVAKLVRVGKILTMRTTVYLHTSCVMQRADELVTDDAELMHHQTTDESGACWAFRCKQRW